MIKNTQLAYMMWHRPIPAVSDDDYRASLQQFHTALNKHKTRGFLRSAICQTQPIPGLPGKDNFFMDWYFLQDSSVLDRLNDTAVTGHCEDPHEGIAQISTDESTGLYRHRYGYEGLRAARFIYWFRKPAGQDYEDIYQTIRALGDNNSISLWMRMMGLSPAPEFCLLSQDDISTAIPMEHTVSPLSVIKEY